jgi:LEA14-like dessication related protein
MKAYTGSQRPEVTMTPRPLPVLSVLVPLLFLPACAPPVGFIPPEISLVDVRLWNVAVFETTAVFTLRVLNESPRPLRIDGALCGFSLNGVRIGKGTSDLRMEVPRLQSRTLDVPVHIRNEGLARRLKSILTAGTIDYSLDARLYVTTSRGRLRQITAETAGRFALGDPEGNGLWTRRSGGPEAAGPAS